MQVQGVDPPVTATPAVEHDRTVGPLWSVAKVAQHGGTKADDRHHGGRHAKVPLQVEERQVKLVVNLLQVLEKKVRHQVAADEEEAVHREGAVDDYLTEETL